MTKYPKHLVVLAMATCYQQNTSASFEYAKKLWGNLSEVGHIPMRRAVTFFAGLALKQGAPHVALEVSMGVRNQMYVTIRSIKVAALADLDRADDALPILRGVLEYDSSEGVKNTFTADAIEKLKASVERSNNKDLSREMNQIIKGLEDRKLIDTKMIEDFLSVQIQQSVNLNTQDNRLQSTFRNSAPFNRKSYSRPGLSDNVY